MTKKPIGRVERGPHSARRVYERVFHKDMKLMLPGLRKAEKHMWVIVLLMIVAGATAGAVGGLFTDEYALDRAIQVAGVCNPTQGQHLLHDGSGQPTGCVTYSIVSTTENNGQVIGKNVSTPAGSFYYLNGTVFP